LAQKKVKNKKILLAAVTLITVLGVASGFLLYYFFATPTVYVDQPSMLPSGCISADEAVEIAMPHINQVADENHFKIANIYVAFHNSTLDVLHTRSNSTNAYPEWTITAEFLFQQSTEDWEVSVWADNGQVATEYAPNQHYYG
jgi:hypothetical protein